jgi:hypothetical protein
MRYIRRTDKAVLERQLLGEESMSKVNRWEMWAYFVGATITALWLILPPPV